MFSVYPFSILKLDQTLCMAVFGDFPWKKEPEYVLWQIIGAWIGSTIVFANYSHAINIFEGQKRRRALKTGSLFAPDAVRLVQSLRNLPHLSHSLTTCHRQTVSLTR